MSIERSIARSVPMVTPDLPLTEAIAAIGHNCSSCVLVVGQHQYYNHYLDDSIDGDRH